jgi:hypothetical protein
MRFKEKGWRREWDLNPRYGFSAHTISSRAPSAARTSLQFMPDIKIKWKAAIKSSRVSGRHDIISDAIYPELL